MRSAKTRAVRSVSGHRPQRGAPRATERRVSRRVQTSRSTRLLDISSGGLAIETSVPLELGAMCELILTTESHRIPVTARVLRLRRSGAVSRASLVFERILEPDRDYLEQVLVREVAERMTVVLR